MHGASYVELERAAGPEGSTRKRVSRFAFCSIEPSMSREGDGGIRFLGTTLSVVQINLMVL